MPRRSKTDRSDTESETEPRQSSRNKGKSSKDYKSLHEGRRPLSPVDESSGVTSSESEERRSDGTSSDSNTQQEEGEVCEHDEHVDGDSEQPSELDGFTPQLSDEDDLDQQIQKQKESLEKIRHIEEESKKRITSLEKLIGKSNELSKLQRKQPDARRKEKLKKLCALDEQIENTAASISKLQEHEDQLSELAFEKIKKQKRISMQQEKQQPPSAESTPKMTGASKSRKPKRKWEKGDRSEDSTSDDYADSSPEKKTRKGKANRQQLLKELRNEDNTEARIKDKQRQQLEDMAEETQANAYAKDDTVRNVVIPKAEWVYLCEGQGLADVKSCVDPSPLQSTPKFKIIILITGQAEAAAGHPAMANCVKAALESVTQSYPCAVILLCSPLPHPRDGPEVLKDLDMLGDMMFKLCAEDERLEYARLGMYFYGKHRLASEAGRRHTKSVYLINQELIQNQGLTYEGVQSVQRKLRDKIKSAGLYERYIMLDQKLISFD